MKKKILMALFAAMSLVTLAACAPNSNQVTVGGSTAMKPLVEQVSLDYMKKYPEDIIMVQGGGSGVGLTQVSTGTFQIGNSDIFAEEKSGIDASKLNDHKVAVVGFAPIVNKDINIDNLSTQQLKDVFTGKVKNWKEVGGPDEKITVIGRAAGSGTRVNFDNLALGGEKEVEGPTQDASGTAVTMVSQTPGAISYFVIFNIVDEAIFYKVLIFIVGVHMFVRPNFPLVGQYIFICRFNPVQVQWFNSWFVDIGERNV